MQSVLETNTLILEPHDTHSLLVVFHRCGHSPLQWWHATLGCFDCFGETLTGHVPLAYLMTVAYSPEDLMQGSPSKLRSFERRCDAGWAS